MTVMMKCDKNPINNNPRGRDIIIPQKNAKKVKEVGRRPSSSPPEGPYS